MDCDDEIACTIDTCDPAGGCVHTPVDSFCETTDPCSTPICDPLLGCVSEPKTCPDGQVCSGGICVSV